MRTGVRFSSFAPRSCRQRQLRHGHKEALQFRSIIFRGLPAGSGRSGRICRKPATFASRPTSGRAFFQQVAVELQRLRVRQIEADGPHGERDLLLQRLKAVGAAGDDPQLVKRLPLGSCSASSRPMPELAPVRIAIRFIESTLSVRFLSSTYHKPRLCQEKPGKIGENSEEIAMQVIDLGAWTPYLEQELRAPYFAALLRVGAARAAGTVTRRRSARSSPDRHAAGRVRAVILGQDPLSRAGRAMGLAFSVPQGERLPPSLRNIFTELHTDLGLPQPSGGDLTPWAERGVLLLNTVLTVGRGAANSHAAWGWQRFTDAVLAAMAALPQPVAFVLWGSQAQKKRPLLQSAAPRLVLCAPHPSPLSSYRGFFGSRPFSQINAFLQENGEQPVDWRLP